MNPEMRMDIKTRFLLTVSSAGGLGYLPLAPGTWGTLAGIPLFALLAGRPLPLQLAVLALVCLLGRAAAAVAGARSGVVDDRRIVIDEVAGYLVVVLGQPFSWTVALAAFGLFRLFDVVKLPPAGWIDRHWKTAAGVMADDLAAGVQALVVLRLGQLLLL